MTRRALVLLLIALVSLPAVAAMRRAAMVPGSGGGMMQGNDPLGIGMMSGAMISGDVASVSGTVITLRSGGAPAIVIDATDAKFMSEHMGYATIADVVPGVRISAFIDDAKAVALGGSILARVVMVESEPDLVVTGPVQTIDHAGSRFAVLGITISVDTNTVYGSAFPTFAPVTWDQIGSGNVVNVAASFSGSSILATRVQVISPISEPSSMLRGTVKSIGASSWVITTPDGRDATIGIDAQTRIVGNPKVGDPVQVIVRSDGAGNLVAIAIMSLPATVPPLAGDLRGWVRSIGPSEWTIGGPPGSMMMPEFLIKITATTVIYPNPKVGDRVIVSGSRDSSGIFVATKIALQQ